MLSSEERRLFEAIERQLRSEDPDLARRLAGGPRPMRHWARAGAATLAVAIVFALVVGAVSIAAVVALGGAGAILMMFIRAVQSTHGW